MFALSTLNLVYFNNFLLCPTIPGTRHSIVITICVFVTCTDHTVVGPLASMLRVPGPVGAVSPLSAELTAGLPACHALCLLFVLRFLNVDVTRWTGGKC